MVIYPNPNDGKFTLYFGNELTDARVEIFDVQGKLLNSINIENNDSTRMFDISEYQKGMYIVQVSSEQQVQTLRIIKQ